ncbi:thioester reductase domain-containing protein [Bowmanella denitrificans]|uniref:thioester reductase domain-containing protein n=1 Tax=Bowmanella denitrificans TaxID=366582 RepID=UPI000C9AC0AC|nr:thioester reductase domain-containing protein [Bowmanella denitrificans]
MDYRNQSQMQNIFVTGATGVLGARVLMEILLTTHACVYCLSRASEPSQAQADIERMLAVYDPQGSLAEHLWRVIPVIGDVSQANLGLSSDVYQELAHSMDLVIHSAANVSLMASFEKLSPVNLDGTQRIVDFCLQGGASLLFVSSFSVIGDHLYHPVTLQESQLDIGQGFEDLGYERSKFSAEQLVRKASEQGLRWSIVRPGNIWGDSETGCYPLFETKVRGIYYEMIRALVETGYSYPSEEDFDISPVDYVARASLYVAMNPSRCCYQTYHLTNPKPVNFNQLVGLIRGHGYRIRELSQEDYFGALYEERMVRDGRPYHSAFTDLLTLFLADTDLEEQAKWDTSAIDALLADTDIRCARSDQRLMSRYLDYAARRNWIASVDKQGPLASLTDEVHTKVFMDELFEQTLAG